MTSHDGCDLLVAGADGVFILPVMEEAFVLLLLAMLDRPTQPPLVISSRVAASRGVTDRLTTITSATGFLREMDRVTFYDE